MPQALVGLQESGIEYRDDFLGVHLGAHRIIALLHALQSIALLVGVPGLGVVFAVFEGFGQSKQEVDPRLGVQFGIVLGSFELGLHGGDVFIAEAKGLEVSQAPPGFAASGLEPDALAVGGNGFLLLACCLQCMPKAQPRPGHAGAHFSDLAVSRDRVLGACGRREHRCQQVPGIMVARLQGNGLLDGIYGVFQSVLLFQRAAKIEVCLRIVRCGSYRAPQQALRFVQSSGSVAQSSQQPQRVDVLRLLSQQLAADLLGFVEAPGLVVLSGQRQRLALRVERE